jgi:c-di-GMP-binding flagellar brake protein YcgR
VIDISGAGFALAARTALRPDDLVYIDLPIEGESVTVPLIGKVLNVTRRKTTDEFIMHAEFAGLSPDEQERIFQFVYSQVKRETAPAA